MSRWLCWLRFQIMTEIKFAGDELQQVELQLEPGWAWLITPQGILLNKRMARNVYWLFLSESVGLGSRMVGDLIPSGSQATSSQPANQAGFRLSASQLRNQTVSKYPPKPSSSSDQPSSKAGAPQSPSSCSQPRRPPNKSAANKSKVCCKYSENFENVCWMRA